MPSLLNGELDLDKDVIIPCGPKGGDWVLNWILDFLTLVEPQFSMPTTKYHLMGFSRGCTGIYNFSVEYPEKVASIVALAGGKSLCLVPKLLTIPILLIHGESDKQISIQHSIEMHAALKDGGVR